MCRYGYFLGYMLLRQILKILCWDTNQIILAQDKITVVSQVCGSNSVEKM